MKPTLIEFIPVYGMLKYFKRYFAGQQRNDKDARIAMYMEMYHLCISLFVIMFIITYFKYY